MEKVRTERFNFIFYSLSMFYGVLIGSFFQAKNWFMTLLISNIFLGLMIYFIINKNKEINNLNVICRKMERQSSKLNIPLASNRVNKELHGINI